MNTKNAIGVIVVLAVIGGGYYFYMHPTEKREEAQKPAGKIVPNWKFESQGTDTATGAERTKVILTLGDKTYDGGTYNGSCAEIGASGGVDGKGLVAGEVSGVQCWFAGGGDEVGLFQEGGRLMVKHGELGEPQGDGTGAFRGNFTSLVEVGQ